MAALEDLIEGGDPAPSAAQIAERAGISLRSIYVHFASVEDLHLAVAERATARVLTLLWPIDPAAPLARRVEELVTQRARVADEIGPLRRAAALHAVRSPALATARATARQASLDQLRRVFASELAELGPAVAARRVAVIDTVISGEGWDALRSNGGLSADQARAAAREAVLTLLTAPPTDH